MLGAPASPLLLIALCCCHAGNHRLQGLKGAAVPGLRWAARLCRQRRRPELHRRRPLAARDLDFDCRACVVGAGRQCLWGQEGRSLKAQGQQQKMVGLGAWAVAVRSGMRHAAAHQAERAGTPWLAPCCGRFCCTSVRAAGHRQQEDSPTNVGLGFFQVPLCLLQLEPQGVQAGVPPHSAFALHSIAQHPPTDVHAVQRRTQRKRAAAAA